MKGNSFFYELFRLVGKINTSLECHSCGSRNPCSKRNGTLYTGVTSNIVKIVYEHKHVLIESFTKKYYIHHHLESHGFLLPQE